MDINWKDKKIFHLSEWQILTSPASAETEVFFWGLTTEIGHGIKICPLHSTHLGYL